MSTSLIIFLTLHVSLMLLAAIAYYAMLLTLFNKRSFSYKSLYIWTTVSFTSSVVALFIAGIFLLDYYKGLIGYVTDPSVSSLSSVFAQAQILLSVLLLLAAISAFLIVWIKGHRVGENVLISLSIIGVVSAAALMFLGVLIP